MRHPGEIGTQRYLAFGATTLAGFVALGLALPDNSPPARLLNDPPDRAGHALASPADAMAPWRNFPVGDAERPLIVFGATELPVGLRSDPALSALVNGRWVLPDRIPGNPPRMDGYPLRSAAEAVADLHSRVVAEHPEVRTAAPAAPVRITEILLDRRTYDTDRGRLVFPAWTIVFDPAVAAPASVLAVTGDRFYPAPVPTDAQGDVTISPDGRRLTYNFLGAAPGGGNCRADYTPVFLESATAVALGAVEHPHGHNRNGTCRLASYRRSVSVLLSVPLSNRVVVTYTYGAPLPVRPDGTYRWYRPTVDDR